MNLTKKEALERYSEVKVPRTGTHSTRRRTTRGLTPAVNSALQPLVYKRPVSPS
jgi:hypothetical protein